MPSISFRELQKVDLPILHNWLNRPHMRAFYQTKPVTLKEVFAKYEPRLKGQLPVRTHVTLCDGLPIGKMQCYLIQDYPKYAAEIGIPCGISLDLFIGDEKFLGKGIGSQMLKAYIDQIALPSFPHEKTIYLCHETNNVTAIATSKSVGFKFLGNVMEEGKLSSVFSLSRT